MIFLKITETTCALCGDLGKMTGEHKLKRTLISRTIGTGPAKIGPFKTGVQNRLAQSASSKSYHFKSQICESCNTRRTQSADREFDRFLMALECEPDKIGFVQDYFENDNPNQIQLFRYLGKILALQIADEVQVAPIALGHFAIGRSLRNPLQVSVDRDPSYVTLKSQNPGEEIQLLSIGGLLVTKNPTSNRLDGFFTSISINDVRLIFGLSFGFWVRSVLRYFHPDLYKKCNESIALGGEA